MTPSVECTANYRKCNLKLSACIAYGSTGTFEIYINSKCLFRSGTYLADVLLTGVRTWHISAKLSFSLRNLIKNGRISTGAPRGLLPRSTKSAFIFVEWDPVAVYLRPRVRHKQQGKCPCCTRLGATAQQVCD